MCKENPSERDINQGTMAVFNLDSCVSDNELRQIFGFYGEIKEVTLLPPSFAYINDCIIFIFSSCLWFADF